LHVLSDDCANRGADSSRILRLHSLSNFRVSTSERTPSIQACRFDIAFLTNRNSGFAATTGTMECALSRSVISDLPGGAGFSPAMRLHKEERL